MHLATFKMKTSCGNAFIVQRSLCKQYWCNRGFPPTSLYHAHLKLQRNTSCGIRQTYFTGRFLTKKFGNFPGQYRFFTAQNGSAHLENDIWYVFYSQACIASQLYLFPVVHPDWYYIFWAWAMTDTMANWTSIDITWKTST